MNATPYQPRIGPDQVGVPVVDKARPWLALRPGESLPEWRARMSHTCWRCGAYIVDHTALDRHELRPVSDVDPDLMRVVARSVPRVDSTAPPVEQVDLVASLVTLSREITEHNRRIMAGEQVDWLQLAGELTKVALACHDQATLKLDDGTGEAGSQ